MTKPKKPKVVDPVPRAADKPLLAMLSKPLGKRLDVPIVVDPNNMTIGGLAKGVEEHAAVMANPLVIDAIATGRQVQCVVCGTFLASGEQCPVDGMVAA